MNSEGDIYAWPGINVRDKICKSTFQLFWRSGDYGYRVKERREKNSLIKGKELHFFLEIRIHFLGSFMVISSHCHGNYQLV